MRADHRNQQTGPRESIPVRVDFEDSSVRIFRGAATMLHARLETVLAPGEAHEIVQRSAAALLTHPNYIHEFREHSALVEGLTGVSFRTVYHLAVGHEPLVPHAHRGDREIRFQAGMWGARLRFSPYTLDEMIVDPRLVSRDVVDVLLPPGGAAFVEFDGRMPHQFGPLYPAEPGLFSLFGVSAHPDERKGLSETQIRRMLADGPTIPGLTECLAPDAAESFSTARSASECALRPSMH